MFSRISRSVRSKLLAVVIITSCAALLVAASALIVYDMRTYEQSRIADLSTLADVLGTACGPALAFQDYREAQDNLALLRVRPAILAGALYDAAGRLFAVYAPDRIESMSTMPLETQAQVKIADGRLSLARPIFERGERVGTLYLIARYEILQRLINSAAIFVVVVLFSLMVAVLVSTWLGRTLSTPIRNIADAARRVMEHRDYSVRVEKTTQDEIGYLVDTFNAMLDEVGRRSHAMEEADRRKDQFLAVLSHELRNPLSPILNAVAVLRLGNAAPDNIDWAARVIERQAKQLARLLDDLMDVARITRNRIELRVKSIDARTVVEMAIEATHSQFEANGQTLQVQLPEAAVPLQADPARMAQVVGNLLNNAAKYTDRGGLIVVSVRSEGEEAIISVRDSGIGIAREDLTRLFEMFTQLSGATDRTSAGLGIGLALVRALVEMHGGHVQAHSAGEGQGSEFVVHLPLDTSSQTATPVIETDPMAPALAPLRVLIVDDMADSVQTLALGIQTINHEVRIANSGDEALAIAEEFQPHVGILDIGMPGMSGYELARHLRATPHGRTMTLIALTGWGQREDVERALAAGFDHHMTKPADFALLHRLFPTQG
jgi:signal transduction histidine kinase/CheY-like chemotaxis protein